MKPAVVVGRVVCSTCYETIKEKKLLLLQPTNWNRKPQGDIFVAVDAVGAGANEFVFYVGAREAAVAFPDLPPVDATIVGIIDEVDIRIRE